MSTGTTTRPITAEEYARLPETSRPTELVRGEVVEMNVPIPKHGYVCLKTARLLGNFVDDNDLGWVFGNDSGVITERNPDTLRGPDVWYVSYEKLPKGPLPDEYLDVVPDLVIEVLSPDDRWSKVLGKVAEYLNIGVPTVCVLDPADRTAELLFPDDRKPRTLTVEDELTFPEALPGFSVRVGKLFEWPS